MSDIHLKQLANHQRIAKAFEGRGPYNIAGDAAACSQSACPRALVCLRFMGRRHPHRQTFADFEFDLETGACDEFWAMYRNNGSGDGK